MQLRKLKQTKILDDLRSIDSFIEKILKSDQLVLPNEVLQDFEHKKPLSRNGNWKKRFERKNDNSSETGKSENSSSSWNVSVSMKKPKLKNCGVKLNSRKT